MRKLAAGVASLAVLYVAFCALLALAVGFEDEDEYDTLYLNPRIY